MNTKIKISLVIGGMCIALSCGVAMQIKTISQIGTTTSRNSVENELRDAVLRTKENYDNLYSDEESAEKLLEKERKNATENNSELTEIQEQIKKLNTQIGLTEVTGKGVIIKVDDANLQTNLQNLYLDPSQTIVHDTDLISIVNELKNAGAEAISINDQRIVANSSIICDGSVIRINGEKVGAPFTIKAIGLPEMLKNTYRNGGYLWMLKYNYSLQVDFKTSDNVIIPKYTGTYSFDYAQNTNDK